MKITLRHQVNYATFPYGLGLAQGIYGLRTRE